jgi:pyruvate/2-oxoglutarate dehydrogenase complex dihydrolipoamide dehydrogenase (E3) component
MQGSLGMSAAEGQAQVTRDRYGKKRRRQSYVAPRGFMKALVEADGDHILGFAMFGAEAGEVMAVVQTAMLAGMPNTGLRDAIIAHPTMAEGLGALFSNLPAR